MIFISWSGKNSRSHQTAILLRDWIPKVIQRRKCFLSSHDIEAGAQWLPKLFAQLEECHVGIVCLTASNLSKPWLLFEAGALAKRLDIARVCPFLIDLEEASVPLPLAAFQIKTGTKEDVRALLKMINESPGMDPLSSVELDEAFDARWPEFEARWKEIKEVSELGEVEVPRKPERVVLEEIHSWVRAIATGNLEVRTRNVPLLAPDTLGWGSGHAVNLYREAIRVHERANAAQAEMWFAILVEGVGEPDSPLGRELTSLSKCQKTTQSKDGLIILSISVPDIKYYPETMSQVRDLNHKLTVIANDGGIAGEAAILLATQRG